MHRISIPDWMAGRAFYNFKSITPRSTALLSIDMQVAFVEPGQPFAMAHAGEVAVNTNRIIDALRKAGGTIAFTRHTVADDGPEAKPAFQQEVPAWHLGAEVFRPGLRGHGVDGRMDCRPGDIVVDKFHMSAFIHHSSDLHARLQARGIDTLIVTGVATNVCCESTARDGSMLNYKVFFISDATATLTDEEHNATLLNVGAIFGDVRSTESMLALLQAANTACTAPGMAVAG